MPTGTMPSKDVIRSRHRQVRATMTAADLANAGDGIASHGLPWAEAVAAGNPATFTAYLGVDFEPPTLPLLHALHEAGHSILLPVCEPDRELSWVFWTPDSEFVRSRYAPIQEPAGERHGLDTVRSAAGMFMPATAVDRSGNRIGQGGATTTSSWLQPTPAACTFRRPPSSTTPSSCPHRAFRLKTSTAPSRQYSCPPGW